METKTRDLFRKLAIAAWAALFAPFLLMPILIWQVDRPPVSLNALKNLKVGATKSEVLDALGAPRSRDSNDRKWFYSRTLGWSIVTVYFDPSGTYLSNYYDF